jgi:DNA-binding Xre family transcriptional regulator
VIANQRQYGITKAQLARFEEALAQQRASAPSPDVYPRIHQAMQDAMESEIVELRAQLERYEELRSGRVAEWKLDSLRELPVALIEGRIAARLTQRELAQRLGVPEQQVQRWEANGYAGVSVDRLQDIADALGVRLSETVAYAVPA